MFVDRHARIADLQAWLLDASYCGASFLPLVLAEDYAGSWVPPKAASEFPHVYSSRKFLHDPRPPISEFAPTKAFVETRQWLAARIRGEEGNSLVEEAALGEWMLRDPEFASRVEQYLMEYSNWLKAAPDVACWSDVCVVVSSSAGSLDQEPDAVLVSPLHPIRLAWHCCAQEALQQALARHTPCPAATILDPDVVPDCILLPLRLADGAVAYRPFISVETRNDYWSVLWNGTRLGMLDQRSAKAPFGADFGITVGGLSSSFSSAQVRRALEDTRTMFAAKANIGVLLTGIGSAGEACTDGVIEWAKNAWAGGDAANEALGRRLLQVYDARSSESARPEHTTVSNLTEDTGGAVQWYTGRPSAATPDLGILVQLDSSQPAIDSRTDEKSPLSAGGLLRHRIRRQLPTGTFLTETRQALPSFERSDSLSSKLSACITRLENVNGEKVAYTFAPNVSAIESVLTEEQVQLLAVSSAAVDPACFLGKWLHGAYLWDYELPSFSRRAGDTNGYYLLSKLRDSERDGLRRSLQRLQAANVDDSLLDQTLLEVARRGIPTVRGLSSLDTSGTGALGVFVATRMLQDEFRLEGSPGSLIPVLTGEPDERNATIIIPVDPFRSYLEEVARSLKGEHKELTYSRPDLVVVGVRVRQDAVHVKVTPVEVKCRLTGVLTPQECESALRQTAAFSKLLKSLRARGEDGATIWTLAFQHLLLSMIAFGMRVYSQRLAEGPFSREWSRLHQQIAAAVFSAPSSVTLDDVGRLVVVDRSPSSLARDIDLDKFSETAVIGWVDAQHIVYGDAQKVYSAVQARLGNWRLLPEVPTAEEEVPSPPAEKAPGKPDAALAEPHAPTNPASGPDAKKPVDQSKGEEVSGVHIPEGADDGVVVNVGVPTDTFEQRQRVLNLSDTRLNQLNIGVVGDLGTGKTQLLKSIIYQVATANSNNGVKPRFLIFDYKNDYSAADFVTAVNAKVVRPHKLPINIFDTRSTDSAAPWLDRFSFFADVLDKIYSGIGPVQRNNLKQAVRRAYDSAQSVGVQPTLADIHREYAAVVGNKPDVPFSIIDDLIDREVFSVDPSAGSFGDFFDGVVVVSLSALGQDDRAKNMVVAAMLNMFYEHMLKIPKRAFRGADPQLRTIDAYLLVDEADNIMQYEFDVLRKILLQGREFGVGVILASQYLKHFRVNATDYREPLLTWFIHKVPNVTAQELAALGLSNEAAELAARVKALPNHHCLYKTAEVDGEIIKDKPFYSLLTPEV